MSEPIDLDALKRLAKAATIVALSPDAALALIAEIEALRAAVQRVRDAHDKWGCVTCSEARFPCATIAALDEKGQDHA